MAEAHAVPELEQALLAVGSKEECRAFLEDILSPQEYEAISNRWMAMCLLRSGLPQRQIGFELGIGVATVSRAARTLRNGTGAADMLMEKLRAPEHGLPL